MRQAVSIALLWLGICLTVNANQVIPIQGHFGKIPISGLVSVLEDPTSELTLEEIQQKKYQNAFVAHDKQGVINLGFSDSTFWVKATLIDHRASNDMLEDLLLEVDFAPLHKLAFYTPKTDGAFQVVRTGALYPFGHRSYEHRNFLFDLPIQPGEKKTFYLQVQSTTSIQLPINIWEKDVFFSHSGLGNHLWGAYIGLMLVMLIYNLFLCIAVRDKSYFYYIAYLAACGMAMMMISGAGYQWFWRNSPSLNEYGHTLFPCLTFASGIMFARVYLGVDYYSKWFDRWLGLLVAVSLITAAAAWFTGRGFNLWATVLAITFALSLLYSGIVAVLAGARPAKYFLAAWSALIVAVVIYSMCITGLLTYSVWAINAIHIATAIEVVLLSFGLADRINQMKKERMALKEANSAALEKSNEILKESNKLKDQFLSTISHELRTPMNGVLGSISLLEQEKSQLAQDKLIAIASRSAHDMINLIESIINFSELQRGEIAVVLEDFQPYALLFNVNRHYAVLAQEKKLQYRAELDCLKGVVLKGDQVKIQRIIENVLNNALKFTNQGGVSIRTRINTVDSDMRNLYVSIADSGIGISQDELDKVYNSFHQADSSLSRKYGGLGIGLAACKKICQLIDAEIKITSSEGRGTVVELNFPVRFVREEPAQDYGSFLNGSDSTTITSKSENEVATGKVILIVEDNVTNIMVLKGIVRKMGAEVLTAENGVEALKVLRSKKVDLILMDCQMPIMDGLEATRRLRNMDGPNKKVPVIAVTANARSEDRNHCIQAGMSDHTPKPVKTKIIKEKIAYWLSDSASPQEEAGVQVS